MNKEFELRKIKESETAMEYMGLDIKNMVHKTRVKWRDNGAFIIDNIMVLRVWMEPKGSIKVKRFYESI